MEVSCNEKFLVYWFNVWKPSNFVMKTENSCCWHATWWLIKVSQEVFQGFLPGVSSLIDIDRLSRRQMNNWRLLGFHPSVKVCNCRRGRNLFVMLSYTKSFSNMKISWIQHLYDEWYESLRSKSINGKVNQTVALMALGNLAWNAIGKEKLAGLLNSSRSRSDGWVVVSFNNQLTNSLVTVPPNGVSWNQQ